MPYYPEQIDLTKITENPNFPITKQKPKKTDPYIPLLVRKRIITQNGNSSVHGEIISGHERYFYAKERNLPSVQCLVVDEPSETLDALQQLNWAHSFGEHGILKHPDAYAHYRHLKSLYLKKLISPELETPENWQLKINDALDKACKTIFTNILGDKNKLLVEELFTHVKQSTFYQQEQKKFVGIFSDEHFKIANIQANAEHYISFVSHALSNAATSNHWTAQMGAELSLAASLQEIFNEQDSWDLLLAILHHLPSLYTNYTQHAINLNNDRLVTQKNLFYATISQNKHLANQVNGFFSQTFLSNLMSAIRPLAGQSVNNLYATELYNWAINIDFLEKINNQLNILYDKVRRDSFRINITRQYIEDCFDQLHICTNIFNLFQLGQHEMVLAHRFLPDIKALFIDKIETAIHPQHRVKYFLRDRAAALINDINERERAFNPIRDHLLAARTQSNMRYYYAQSNSFQAENAAQVLGFLLFMQRSCKHYIKQKINEKAIFLKQRISQVVVDDYLAPDKQYVTDESDGLSEFMFMLKLPVSEMVTTKVKISSKGKYDFHVEQFGSYRKSKDETNSAFCSKANAMLTKANINSSHAVTLTRDFISMPNARLPLPESILFDAPALFSTFVFTLFYIEGLRNPAAFVIHPTLLHSLLQQPLQKLNEAIVSGEFIMTPVGSKAEGESLHALFQPTSKNIFDKNLAAFSITNDNMAGRSITALRLFDTREKRKSLEELLLKQFNLPERKV